VACFAAVCAGSSGGSRLANQLTARTEKQRQEYSTTESASFQTGPSGDNRRHGAYTFGGQPSFPVSFARFGAQAGIALKSLSQWRDNAGTETGHTGKRCMRGPHQARPQATDGAFLRSVAALVPTRNPGLPVHPADGAWAGTLVADRVSVKTAGVDGDRRQSSSHSPGCGAKPAGKKADRVD